jgi:hypothetical protein
MSTLIMRSIAAITSGSKRAVQMACSMPFLTEPPSCPFDMVTSRTDACTAFTAAFSATRRPKQPAVQGRMSDCSESLNGAKVFPVSTACSNHGAVSR